MPAVRKLPLWKTFTEELLTEGISHGQIYPAERFEEALSCKRDSREFGLQVHEIRMELERNGFYLQGHVWRDGSFTIVPPDKHILISAGFDRRIRKNRRRQIALLGTTNRELLSVKTRALFEKMLMRAQIKQLLELRAGRVGKFLARKAPKFLEINQ